MNKSLDLNERIIDNRTKKLSPIITFDLNEILNHFNETICDIQSQGEIANKLPDNNKTDAENIWRAQIIFLASALDFYMHEITNMVYYVCSKMIGNVAQNIIICL